MITRYLWQFVLVAVAAAVCSWLVSQFGPLTSGAAWAAVALVACGVGAILLRTSPVGRVGWQNRVAGYLVPWGARIGGGRLWPIPVVSWVVWMTVWAGAAVLTPPETVPLTGWEIATRIGLGAAWAIDGLALGHLLATVRQHFSPASRSGRSLLTISAVIVGLVAGSLLLHLLGLTAFALLVAGGPPLLIGGGYGLFLLVLLTFGRGGRWN